MSAFDLIDSIADYRVLFVGDDIIDEYHYVESLGKSPKEHLIPVAYVEKEIFQGGVIAAANHLREFCAKVSVCKSLSPVRKVRFVDRTYTRKLFEVHYQDSVTHNGFMSNDYDAVVVADFGHGQIVDRTIERLAEYPFVAVNAQTNSSNAGYNLITKYPRADYIVIDEPEARLAAADRLHSIEDVILKLARGRCDKFVVTHGAHGAVGWDGQTFHRCPAFTDRVVDTMGAGDAFFAVTAPMAKTGYMPDLLRIGNAAGALKTQIVGHRRAITKEELINYLREKNGR